MSIVHGERSTFQAIPTWPQHYVERLWHSFTTSVPPNHPHMTVSNTERESGLSTLLYFLLYSTAHSERPNSWCRSSLPTVGKRRQFGESVYEKAFSQQFDYDDDDTIVEPTKAKAKMQHERKLIKFGQSLKETQRGGCARQTIVYMPYILAYYIKTCRSSSTQSLSCI